MFYSIFAQMMFEQIARKANRLINIKLQRRKKINVNCAVKVFSIFRYSLVQGNSLVQGMGKRLRQMDVSGGNWTFY